MKVVFEKIWWFVRRVYVGGVNRRNVFTLSLNFMVNFLPIFVWLLMFKNAGIIPKSWRPAIRVRFALNADVYLFGDYFREFGSESVFWISMLSSSIFAVVCTLLLPLGVWYAVYYKKGYKYNLFDETERFTQRVNSKGFSPKNMRVMLPFLSLFFAMLFLEVMHLFASQDETNFSKFKDLLAWVSYVILHLTAPILTAVYLYVFHVPGTLKCFSFALGLQNICGLITHMLLPMGPPWFFHLYGINDTEHATYDQPGYAAGLTRVDGHLGTHLNSKGFHISPIVFGAVPSLHSAMAFQCFLFLVLRSTQTKSKPLGTHNVSSFNAFSDDLIPLEALDNENITQKSGPSAIIEQSNDGTYSNNVNQEESSGDDDAEEDYEKYLCSPRGESVTSSADDIFENLLGSDNTTLDGTDIKAILADQRLTVNILNSKWLWIFHKGLIPKFLGSCYILLQWWATQYLDHHFRFDLFIGMMYALVAYLVINVYILQPKIIKPWLQLRASISEDTKNESRTMGMRVFKDTKAEWFFDPLT